MQTIRLFISEWDEKCDWLQTTAEYDVVWSIWAGDRGELSCAHLNREQQFYAKSHELIDAFLACPPDWAQGPPLPRDECGLPLPGSRTGQLVLRFSSADCRCFQVSNPCQAIRSATFVHHTALTDRDFLIRISFSSESLWFCLIILLLFKSWHFPKAK